MARYKVGDKFAFDKGQSVVKGRREIVFAHEETRRYVISYETNGGIDIVSEDYIDRNYTKIEPFFEEGKTYCHKRGGHDTWWIKSIEELDGEKYALAYFRNGLGGNRRPVVIVGRFDEFAVVD